MDIDSIPLFAMLKGRMGYLNQRQQVIAQNVANADTPSFTPKDLQPFKAKSLGGGTLALAPVAQTQPGHMAGVATIEIHTSDGQNGGYKPEASPDSETKLDGNQVVLEEQMMKMNQTRNEYDTAVGIYQKAMGFLTLAAKEPGK